MRPGSGVLENPGMKSCFDIFARRASSIMSPQFSSVSDAVVEATHRRPDSGFHRHKGKIGAKSARGFEYAPPE